MSSFLPGSGNKNPTVALIHGLKITSFSGENDRSACFAFVFCPSFSQPVHVISCLVMSCLSDGRLFSPHISCLAWLVTCQDCTENIFTHRLAVDQSYRWLKSWYPLCRIFTSQSLTAHLLRTHFTIYSITSQFKLPLAWLYLTYHCILFYFCFCFLFFCSLFFCLLFEGDVFSTKEIIDFVREGPGEVANLRLAGRSSLHSFPSFFSSSSPLRLFLPFSFFFLFIFLPFPLLWIHHYFKLMYLPFAMKCILHHVRRILMTWPTTPISIYLFYFRFDYAAQGDNFTSTLCVRKKSSLEIGLVFFTSEFETSLLTKSLSFCLEGKAAVAEVSYMCE